MQQPNLELVEFRKESSTKLAQQIPAPLRPTVPVSTFPASFSRLLSIFDYIAVLRPLLLIPVWTMLLLGHYHAISQRTATLSLPLIGDVYIIWRPDSQILKTLLLYSMLMGAIYILNQISDSYTDEINGKLYLVAGGYIKERNLRIQIGVLLLASIAMAFLQFSRVYLFLILLSIVLGVLYSVSPVRLKGRPILDLLANACGFGLVAFAVGWTSGSGFSMGLILRSLPYAMCISATFINTTIPDMKGDIQNGDTTTGVFLGLRNSCIVSTLFVAAVPIISLLLGDFICLTAALVSLPFFIYMTISNMDERSPNLSAIALATKVSIMVLSLLVAILVPFYILLLIATLLLTRFYYRMRFGISYP